MLASPRLAPALRSARSLSVTCLLLACSSQDGSPDPVVVPSFAGPASAPSSDETGSSDDAASSESSPAAGDGAGQEPSASAADAEDLPSAFDPSEGSADEGSETTPGEATPGGPDVGDEAAPSEPDPTEAEPEANDDAVDEPAPPEPELPLAPRSTLPAPPGGGVPQPSGPAANLRVIDWAGFRAAVTYTFDDATPSQVQNYAALQALGVPLSFYLITSRPEASDPVWARALADGHEIANHTQSHLQNGSQAQLGSDTDAGERFIESRLGNTVYTMAAPYGTIDYADVARTRYLINRGTSDRLIAPRDATDPFNLSCYIPPENAPASAFNQKVDAARSAGSWQVMLVHGFNGDPTAFQPVQLGELAASVNRTKSLGDVWIDTLLRVGAYWIGQDLLDGVTPSGNAGVTTYEWTLPEHFPPGQFLRVTVDGGTLVQNGARLGWDDHGYYEVALDEGRLTLSP